MGLSTFLALFVSVAFAQAPSPQEYLVLSAPPAIMLKIAECESGSQQFNGDGSVVTNAKTKDYGLFQIHYTHLLEAKQMGFDVMTPQGNIAYALYLYKKNGTRDWNASKWCWGGTSPPLQG